MSVRYLNSGELRRREFLGLCACVAAGSVLGACASVLVRQVPVSNGRMELPLVQYPELSHAGAALQILPEGETQPLIVIVDADGKHSVISSECTHKGCTVEVQGERIVCPCHGSTYDRKGEVLKGPAQRSLRRYPSRLTSEGVLIIELAS
ncbi:MAG: ubiquinol-cytochrome c reductase iron-sulfur subunit [Gemmatimonadaceae bacterium]